MRVTPTASRIRSVKRLMVMQQTIVPTPFGPIRVRADAAGLRQLAFVTDADGAGAAPHGLLAEARDQLEAYFAGELTTFELPLAPVGTPFHERVWAQVSAIAHGRTATYGELAAQLGVPAAARAVGAANGRNPIAIVIPCHRVVGANGSLTGYAYGVDRKAGLLALERGARPLALGA
jgi:methylated-DNA-[protein]-cysteine S-methyltransferase